MPLVSQTFDQLLDFTRTTSGTFVGSNGLIQTTPASVNLLTWTQQFDNAAWGKSNATVTANTTVAPDGTSTADTLVEDTANSQHYIFQSSTVVANTRYVQSVYAKAAGRNWIWMTEGNNVTAQAFFDLANGVVGTVSGTGSPTASITAIGNGWYRCSLAFTPIAAFANTQVRLANANGGASYTGDGTSGAFIWGAQLEVGSTATTYTRNNGGVFPPRFDYDPVTLAPKGILIEEQRTNLVTYSAQFDDAAWSKGAATVTANATTSPDGTANADKLAETATTAAHYALQTITVATGAYTASVFVKAAERTWCIVEMAGTPFGCGAWFNLSTGAVGTQFGSPSSAAITAAGNGWWRITVTKTAASAGSASIAVYAATGDNISSYAGTAGSGIFVWGAQLEAGAFATSYIPTVASQVTRTADQCSIVAPNFAPWYNQSAGTLFVEATGYSATTVSQGGTAPTPVSLYATAAVSPYAAIAISRRDSAVLNSPTAYVISDSGVVGADISQSSINWAGTTVKAAFAWNGSTDAAFTANGATVGTDTSYTLPTPDSLQIGRWGSESITGYWSGHIRSIRYYPTRLTNAQLQALTA